MVRIITCKVVFVSQVGGFFGNDMDACFVRVNIRILRSDLSLESHEFA